MALTTTEQLDLMGNVLKPTSIGDKTLMEYAHASGLNYARDFNPSHKNFAPLGDTPTQAEKDANTYLDKMLSATAKMIISDSKSLAALNGIMASLISEVVSVTSNSIISATTSQWEGFINNNILEAIELLAGIRVQERIEYNLLP